jgi:RNA polymerase sigma-70 factor (ECF subfamily)
MSTYSRVEDLIAQAVSGDRNALEQLLLNYHDRLADYVRSQFPPLLQGVSEVEDVLHKAYVKVFRGIATFEGRTEETFYAWLRTVARNQLADDVKHRRRERRAPQQPQDGQHSWVVTLSEWVVGKSVTPSRKAARQEAIRAIQVALAALPEDYRQAIWLRYMQGLSLEEAAKRMGRSPDSVRGLCARARQKLRAMMGHASSYLSG